MSEPAPKPARRFDRSIVEGPIGPAVWRLAWPTMLQNIIAGLQGIGLEIEELPHDNDLWEAIWRLWCEYDLALRQNNWGYIFEGRKASIVW